MRWEREEEKGEEGGTDGERAGEKKERETIVDCPLRSRCPKEKKKREK